jgi:hypothetical protein
MLPIQVPPGTSHRRRLFGFIFAALTGSGNGAAVKRDSGLQAFSEALAQGMRDEQAFALMIGSDEYLERLR